jgi:hypothetical protein
VIFAAICTTCLQRFEIRVAPSERGLLEQLTSDALCKCPMSCGGEITMGSIEEISKAVVGKKLAAPMSLTGTQFYQAVNGLPLPSQVPPDEMVLDALLRTHGVTKTKFETVGSRVYIHELTLSNGVTIHLCAGGRGAQVLKITRAPDAEEKTTRPQEFL